MSETYSRDEVKEILGRALERQHAQGDSLTHDELAAVAKDMGLSPEALASAATGVREERRLEAEIASAIARRRRGFSGHLLAYLMVNALLVVISLLVGGPPWPLIVALAWAIGLAFHARAAYAPDRERLAAHARRRFAREREAEERQRRKQRAQETARRLEGVLADGVVAVLETVAAAIDPARPEEANKPATGVRVDPMTPPDPEDPREAQREAQQGVPPKAAARHGER